MVEDPALVTQNDLRDNLSVLLARNYKGSTLKSYYVALNAFFEFLIFEGICVINPIPAFQKRYLKRLIKQRKGETRQIISIDDMKRVVNQADEIQINVIPVILAKTGLRRGEFLDKGIINIRQKAKRSRQVMFVDDELHTVLDEYVEWRKVHSTYRYSGSAKRPSLKLWTFWARLFVPMILSLYRKSGTNHRLPCPLWLI